MCRYQIEQYRGGVADVAVPGFAGWTPPPWRDLLDGFVLAFELAGRLRLRRLSGDAS